MTVADGTGIEKGAVLIGSDPNTAATHTGAVATVVGIAAYEKIASNGQTSLGVYRRGRFKGKASGTITFGDPLVTDSYVNHLKSARGLTAFDLSGTRIIGYALETAATGETFLYELQPTPMNGV